MQWAVEPCTGGTCTSDEDQLAAVLAKYGPLSVCINSGDGQGKAVDWDKYEGGVLSSGCKAKYNKLDHCVQLVGYDKTASPPYWKVRNEWSTSWGEAGFIRLPMGENSCCIGCEASVMNVNVNTSAWVQV